MPFDPVYLAYGGIFLFVLLLVEGLFYLVTDSRRGSIHSINRRLRMLESGANSKEVLYRLRRTPAGDEGGLAQTLREKTPLAKLDGMITQAGMTVTTNRMLGIMAAIFGGSFIFFGVFMGVPMVTNLILSLFFSICLPLMFLAQRKGRRLKKFGEQFPDSLDLIVRSLRAGHPISTSMALVSKEMSDPIGTEFGIAVDEMTYGLDLRDVLLNMSGRIPLQDLHYLVVSISVQHGTGGNLAEVLAGLSTVIRDRYRMFAKIKALSAEGRMSATILGCLPIGVTVAIWVINPTYFIKFADDPLFPVMMSIGVGLLLLGILVMWKMVKIRV